jgi:hypothetical protein
MLELTMSLEIRQQISVPNIETTGNLKLVLQMLNIGIIQDYYSNLNMVP